MHRPPGTSHLQGKYADVSPVGNAPWVPTANTATSVACANPGGHPARDCPLIRPPGGI